MEIVIHPSAEVAAAYAAKVIANLIFEKPNAVIGLATGRTPLRLYQELTRYHQQRGLDFSRVSVFCLDEYVGLSPEHPASFSGYLQRNLFSQINIKSENIFLPNGLTANLQRFCVEYERNIAACGGIDLQILGIGTDGHIGFNEPVSSLSSRTRIKTLTEETRRENAAEFGPGEEVPSHVITMGLGTILETKRVVLLAFGEQKAEVVAKMVEGPVTAMVPATALQFHREAHIVLDEAAAVRLVNTSYYREVFSKKPDWQKD